MSDTKNYSETAELAKLLAALDTKLLDMNAKFEATNDYSQLDECFSITIGKETMSFVLGGPQTQALLDFVQSIATENLYSVDYKNNTVTE